MTAAMSWQRGISDAVVMVFAVLVAQVHNPERTQYGATVRIQVRSMCDMFRMQQSTVTVRGRSAAWSAPTASQLAETC